MTDELAASKENELRLKNCEQALGHTFVDRSLLELALTHSSLRDPWNESNERLEFLGDAVVGAVVSEYLFCHFPELPEGELTRLKSIVVSRSGLGRIAKDMGIKDYLRVGKGIRKSRSIPISLQSNAMEAIVGAVYLDCGFESCRDLVVSWLEESLQRAARRTDVTNYKAALQQMAQKLYQQTPRYNLLETVGPDHKKEFVIEAVVGKRQFEAATGSTKKQAEQRAARSALRVLKKENAS